MSVGVVVSAGTTAVDTLLATADKALYQAKNVGRNRVVFAAESLKLIFNTFNLEIFFTMTVMSIEQLKPAMVLAADVRSRTGRLLATRNTSITAQHVIDFRTWGILEVKTVKNNGDNDSVESNTSP